ncbi:MAG: hypothetical protein COA31_006930 [Flavobacteriales bacterium]|nr:hypothetical protein [Flavobacteriales bacterium]
MPTKYGRFHELKTKALEYLQDKWPTEEELTYAVNEIAYINQNDVSEHTWEDIQVILNKCKTHKAIGDEGVFRASINKMTEKEKIDLKQTITFL